MEDLWDKDARICKIWFAGRIVGGELTSSAPGAAAERIVEAAFLSREELAGKTVYPPVLHEQYWTDKASGFNSVRYLGIREMITE